MDIDALIRQHQSEVFSLCRSMVRDPDVAEDLAQDSLAKAFAARDGFRGEASARTWLMAIARNRCRDHLRRQHGSPFVDDPDVAEEGPVDDAPLPATMLSDQGQVRIALESLPEAWRAMVVLRFVHGFSYDELSATFGIGNGAARMVGRRKALARRRCIEHGGLLFADESLAAFETEAAARGVAFPGARKVEVALDEVAVAAK